MPSEANGNTESGVTTKKKRSRRHMGRKAKDIDLHQMEKLMWCHPTLEMTALFFDCSDTLIHRIIKQNYGLTFEEFRDKNKTTVRNWLVQKAIQLALEKNNVQALSLALKNMAGWSDSVQLSPVGGNINLRYSLDAPPQNPEVKDVTPG